MTYLILFGFGCLSGLTTVLFGFGGGFVAVPVMYWCILRVYPENALLQSNAMQIAVATSVMVMLVNTAQASYKHYQKGNWRWDQINPLAIFIGVGAIIATYAIRFFDTDLLKTLFVLYLALTILDALIRKGFIQSPSQQTPSPLSKPTSTVYGLIIGFVATLLGVGGSIMTVPLMRRRGYSMTQATALASPLSLPVAVLGSAGYLVLGLYSPLDLGRTYIGYIDLAAFLALAVGSWLGIRLCTPLIGKLPDQLHAKIYIALLAFVLLSVWLN
ncbi:sulfite exporter TauE/SafE family protein [Pseudomonas sp. F1_0610]|uniref:sulfite exporter TauE/SafE family protein n=1 Tax=Pseudomonas sp. F1_0610 TaxID=3114284 RepID=UPI0039C3E292